MALLADFPTTDLDSNEDPRCSTANKSRRKRPSSKNTISMLGQRKAVLETWPSKSAKLSQEYGEAIGSSTHVSDDPIGVIVILCNGTTPETTQNIERSYLVDSLYSLDRQNPRLAIDMIVDHLDELQNGGDFDECNALLFLLDPIRLTDPTLVSILGITLAAKTQFTRLQLAGRDVFYRLALGAVAKRRGSDGADKLLTKYR